MLLLFSVVLLQVLPANAQSEAPSFSTSGPFVDKVRFEVITQDDAQVRALLQDEIDLIGESISPSFLAELQEAEDIQVVKTPRNGYGFITINCAKYPLSITAFRRAFAFALNKTAIATDICEGLAVPLDSCIPMINPWSIEGQLPYNYYDSDVSYGNFLLNEAGFWDVNDDGFREAPDGTDFEVLVESSGASMTGIETARCAVDALLRLDIDARFDILGFDDMYRLVNHEPYDMMFLGWTFADFDVDWLAYQFWSEYADERFWNFPNFRNDSYDAWRGQLMNSTDYDDVYEAAKEMQKIIAYECPIIICYENYLLSAYRTDKFEGFVNDVFDGAHSIWSNFNVRLKSSQGGPFGGTLRRSIPLGIDTFNIMSASSGYTIDILDELYDSLIVQNPNGGDIPWLAESFIVETHADNEAVPTGWTRIIFHIASNATWSDGTPLTADDVAHTLLFYRNSPGNRFRHDLTDMISAFARTPNVIQVEFSSESMWHLHSVGYKPILPKQILVDLDPEEWHIWNPQPLTETMITSGPFNVSAYVPGEYIELTRNPRYFRGIQRIPSTTTSTTTSNTIPVISSIDPMGWLGATVGGMTVLGWTITLPSIVVIVVVAVKWRMETGKG